MDLRDLAARTLQPFAVTMPSCKDPCYGEGERKEEKLKSACEGEENDARDFELPTCHRQRKHSLVIATMSSESNFSAALATWKG